MMRRWFATLLWLVTWGAADAAGEVTVGSKRFTESYILAEVITQTLRDAGVPARHRPGLGNTGILEQALAGGSVDVYPEYTGTIVRELLKREGNPSLDELNQWLAPRGLKVAVPLGFNNTYALALTEEKAAALDIKQVSDLLKPEAASLRIGLSHEFLERADGWPALKAAYRLRFDKPQGLDHGLAYQALARRQIDITDVYTTDAQIGRQRLRVLVDDLGFFPAYDAVLLMRSSLDVAPLMKLAGRIDNRAMIAMNAQAEIDRLPFADVAKQFLTAGAMQGGSQGFVARVFAPDFARLGLQHLLLVFGSLLLAIMVGVPMGIAAWAQPRLAGLLVGAAGVLQTVPSLALLAFLIAIVGRIGLVPAVIALFLYALLPIVLNTHAGLRGVPAGLAHAAQALGLTARQTLRHVQLPLALPTMVAGVKAAAVINVGTATMAAFIGAGGYGERIVAGLAINDNVTMLAGALPAAALALLVQGAFVWIERHLPSAPRTMG